MRPDANAVISHITDRMPAILPREAWPIWLGETDASLDQIKALLTTFEDHGRVHDRAAIQQALTSAKGHPQADLF